MLERVNNIMLEGVNITQKRQAEIWTKMRIKSDRSRHRRYSVRKGVLRNFTKFTGRHLCQNLFFNKVTGLRPATLLTRDSGTGAFL